MGRPPKKNKSQYSVKLDKHVAAALKTEAEKQHTDRSNLIESIARPYLTRRGHKLPKPR
jgi:metal-responsive CopG/Arc/MetJ family transcriptional regulator